MKEFWFLFNMDAVDVSFVTCWVLMEMQACRRLGVHDIGFMDPQMLNETLVRDFLAPSMETLFTFLDLQRFKDCILISYHCHFQWILIIIVPDLSLADIFDSIGGYSQWYESLVALLNAAWDMFLVKWGALKEKLQFYHDFPCLKQPPGTNLCGFYVCEFIHHFASGSLGPFSDKMVNIKEGLLETQ